ncbi:hypothetical protein OG552_11795 [Streptomyces sp. NBC_01476]|uniref:hypothetical protein n=1 Tax=Streptomyces sp. NBC_01476 TaxID=2903881 RepID=UPI002E339232|nr:hypothetical protein [Streptomyces sp. NBC_01476]
MMGAWVMFISGCTIVGLATRSFRAAREPRGAFPRAPLGQILLGAGLALDGVPRIAGWSPGVDSAVAAAGLLTILAGAALQLRRRAPEN